MLLTLSSASGSHKDITGKYREILEKIFKFQEPSLTEGLKTFTEACKFVEQKLLIRCQLPYNGWATRKKGSHRKEKHEYCNWKSFFLPPSSSTVALTSDLCQVVTLSLPFHIKDSSMTGRRLNRNECSISILCHNPSISKIFFTLLCFLPLICDMWP